MSKYNGANDGMKKVNPNPEAKLAGAMRLMMEKKKFEGNTARSLSTADSRGGDGKFRIDNVRGGKVWE